jgi:PAS domain S-box-containing protein
MKKSTKKNSMINAQENEKYYRYIIENSEEAILLTNPNGNIDYANPEACKLFGRTAEEICRIGRNGIVDLNDPRLPAALEIRKRTGKFKGELNFVKKDGTIFPGLISSVIFKDSNGKESTSMIIRDITKQKKVEEDSKLLTHTIKSIEEIITITNLEDRFTYVNQAFCDIYGYTYEEIIGKHVKILVSPNNPPELLKEILSQSQKDSWKGEILNLTKDGKEFPIYLQTSQILDENGKIIGLAGVSEDISERKQAELELKKSEEKYHAIFDATGTATLIVEEDTTISMANKECIRLTGYTQTELIGTKWIHYVEPTSLQEMLKNHNLRRQKPELAPKNYEVKLINKNCEIRYAILDIGVIPGTKQSIVSILDITERKRAEEAILNSQIFLDSIVNQSPYAMWISDEKGTLIRLNEACCKMLNISEEEVIGKYNVLKDNIVESQGFIPLVKNVFEKGETAHFELQYDSSQLRSIPLEKSVKVILDVTIFPIKNASGKTTNAVIQHVDISERKKTEEVIKKAQLLLKSSIESPKDMIILSIDKQYKYLYFNTYHKDVMVSAYGKNVKLGMNLLECISNEDDRKKAKINYDRALKGESHITIEEYGDLNRYYYETRYNPIINDKNEVIGATAFSANVTERKQAEEKLRKSEMQISSALDIAHLGPWEYDIFKDEFTFNNHFYKIFRTTAEQVGGYKMSSLEYARRFVHPDDLHMVADETRLAIETTNPNFNRQIEHRIIYADGTIGYITVLFFIIKDDKGNTIKTYGVNQDITERKMAEEAIKISEEKFRKVFSTSPDSININRLDDGMYVAINNGFTQSTGYTEEDVEGKTSKELNIWDNPDDRKKLIEGLKSDGIVKNLEARFRKKNGDVNYGLMSASIIDLNGVPHIISITRDITDRKEAEEVIQESERKFRETVENLQEGYYKCTIDGILLEHNPAFCEILGFDSDKNLIGVKLPDFWQNPDDRDVYLKEMTKVGYIKNYTVNAKNNSEEKMHILVNSHFLKDDNGNFNGIEGTIVDLTEQKRAEDALRESEAKYRNLIETMPEGFYRSKPEGYFIDVNPAIVKMLGYESTEELLKVNIPEELYFTKDERIDGVNYNIDFVPDTDIYRLKKKDGSEIWVEDHSRYIQDNSGNVLFHEGIMRDITESLRAQKTILEAKEKAEEVSRLKTSFLASMSHEIRTPLNGILGFADILKNELKDPAHKKFADIIEKSGNRLLETLDLILSFSKLEAEKEDVHYSNVRIENVIDEVLKSFEVVAKNKNLFLNLSIKEEKLVTNIDERFLRQILNNLINNALKYTDSGGITITLLKDNNNVVINVKDTGIGIAEDKHKIIFEEFRQESEGHGRSFEGTGLGLAITKRFVELMKGTIEVESEVGVGSIFTVKFPYEKAPETITIKMQKEEPKKEIMMPVLPDKDKLSVLLVENDLMNLDYTITVLNEYYNIESAVDGTEAMEKVKNKIFDIILMDINLGKGMDGITVVQKIRKIPEYTKTPIVALTAFVLPGDREEFLKGGCTHYLGKPFTRNQILELLKKIKV